MGLYCLKAFKSFLFIFFFAVYFGPSTYANLPKKPIGFVAEVVGKVNKIGQGKDIKIKSPIFSGDRFETSLSALKAFFIDNTLVYLGPESLFRIDSFFSMNSRSFFRLYKGVVRFASYHQKNSKFSLLKTSALDIEYKQSDFLIRVFPYKSFFRTQIIVFRGKVKLSLFNEIGRRPFVLKKKESMVFYHNGSGNLLRAPLRGAIPNKAFKLLLAPRVDGGKIFLYELASLYKKKRNVKAGRSPSSREILDLRSFKKKGLKNDSMVFSSKDLEQFGRSKKVDPVKASKKEMDRALKQDDLWKRRRPLN